MLKMAIFNSFYIVILKYLLKYWQVKPFIGSTSKSQRKKKINMKKYRIKYRRTICMWRR